MTAFQRGSYAESDRLFSAFRGRHPRDARNEDAAFLRAVARSRLGDTAGAAAFAAEYLRAFPGGLRRAEAERLQGALGKKP
jgi:outer membrane protein assembly factor BamD (BamD/ComL family)